MGRSGYVDDFDDVRELNMYRGAVERSILGKRGQAFLCEMAAALDAMPVKELLVDEIVREDGAVCAIGAVAVARKQDVSQLDQDDGDCVGKTFGIASSMAREIAFVNDNDFAFDRANETPAERWVRVRAWVAGQLVGGS